MFKAQSLFPLFIVASAFAQTTVTLPDSICQTGTTVTWAKQVTAYCEGPAYESSTGYVYFTEQSGGANWPIWRIRPGADTGLRWVNQYQSNGLEFDPQGRLVAVQNGRLTRYTSAGTVDSTLVLSGQNGVNFNQANDLSIGTNGAIYFTDLGANVYFLSTGRVLSVAVNGQQSANGVEWIEERNFVYVNNAVTNGLTRRFNAPAAGGTLSAPATFATPVGTPDGATFDSHGNYYTASYSTGNIVVFNAAGVNLGTIALRFASGAYDGRAGVQGNASNCAFGGPNNNILYMTGDGGLYSLQMRIPGRVRPGTPIRNVGMNPLPKSGARFLDLLGRKLEGVLRRGSLYLPRDRSTPL